MEFEKFSPAGPDPGQYGSDRDIFLRVWRRVMPEETPACPITVDTGEPARPAPPSNDMSVQTLPAPVPHNMPAPDTSGDSSGDDFPTPEDVPCLGSGGQPDLEQLRMFISQELMYWQIYRTLAQRSGQSGRMLAALAGNCRKRSKRLSAALFLISGVRFWPAEPPAVPMPRSYFGTLRELFLAEQNRGGTYRAGAEDCRDACLQALYLELADECMEHACRIRTLLENS